MNWLKSLLLNAAKSQMNKEIDGLSQYEPQLADIIRKNVDPDKTATLIVNYVQDLARKYVDKI